MHQGVLDVA